MYIISYNFNLKTNLTNKMYIKLPSISFKYFNDAYNHNLKNYV